MDALLFDFDGVIADSEPVHYEGFFEVLAEVGITLPRERYYQNYLGYDDRDAFPHIYGDLGIALSTKTLESLIAAKTILVQEKLQTISPIPGTTAMIHAAHAAGIPLAICSGALRAEVDIAARAIGVRECFPVVVAAEDVARGKPDPEGFTKALAQLGAQLGCEFDPAQTLVIEDSPAGIASGKAGGMKVCALQTSYPHSELLAADRIVETLEGLTPADLAAIVAG